MRQRSSSALLTTGASRRCTVYAGEYGQESKAETGPASLLWSWHRWA